MITNWLIFHLSKTLSNENNSRHSTNISSSNNSSLDLIQNCLNSRKTLLPDYDFTRTFILLKNIFGIQSQQSSTNKNSRHPSENLNLSLSKKRKMLIKAGSQAGWQHVVSFYLQPAASINLQFLQPCSTNMGRIQYRNQITTKQFQFIMKKMIDNGS